MQSKQMVNNELIIKFLTGESSKTENLLIDQWLKENKDNQKYFDEIEYIWNASGVSLDITDVEKNNDWNIILDKIGKKPEIQSSSGLGQQTGTSIFLRYKTKKGLHSILRIAAIFILAFGFSYTIFYFTHKPSNNDSLACNKVITHKGQKSQIILSDGTKIMLNTNSTLTYPTVFDEKKREVILEGEAYFEVQKQDNNIPFIIKTSEIDIEVTGTSFNVMAYANEGVIETTLVEGYVTLYRGRDKLPSMQPIYLKPNQKATLVKKGSQISICEIKIEKPTLALSTEAVQNKESNEKEEIIISPEVDVKPHIAWKDDQLMFRSESLENICYKLERWFDVEIQITDDKLRKACYTGKFTHKESLNQVLEIIEMTTPIQYIFNKNLIIIDRAID